ncbi:MAG: hypothetical protein AAF821_18255 [Cyanobacteria bacterium P01_D01_bin.156]
MAQPARKSPEPNRQQSQRTPLIKPAANDNRPQLPVQEKSQGGSMLGRWGSRIGNKVVPAVGLISTALKPTILGDGTLSAAQNKERAELLKQAQEQKAAIAKTLHDRGRLQTKLEALEAKGQQEAARVKAQSERLEDRQGQRHEVTRQVMQPRPSMVQGHCAPGMPTKDEVQKDIKNQELLGRANDAVQDRFIDKEKSPFDLQQAQRNTAEASTGTHETFTEGQLEKIKNDAQTLINKRLEGIENIPPNQHLLLDHYYQAWAAKVNELGIDKAYNKGTDILATKEVIKKQESRAQETNRLGTKLSPSEQSVVSLVRDNSPYLLGRCSFQVREKHAKETTAEAAQQLRKEEQEQREKPENSRFNTKEPEPPSPPMPTIER